jgi:hypothetical protein
VSIAAEEGFREVTRGEWVAILSRTVRPAIEPLRKRKYRRYPVEPHSYGEARISFSPARDPSIEPAVRSGPLLDLSPAGLMVKVYGELPVGVPVRVQLTLNGLRLALRGRIAHCTNTLGGFKVGVELQF